MRDSDRWFALGYGIWLVGIFAYFVPAATWNPVSRFDLTRAIVEEHTLSIDAYADNTGDRALREGHWYTDKAPVPSILALPVYAAFDLAMRLRGARPEYSVFATSELPAIRVSVNGTFQRGLYLCSLFTAGLGTAVLGVLLFQLLSRRFTPRAALFGSAGSVLGTSLLPYATSFYGHAVAAAFLVAALHALFLDPAAHATRGHVRLAGACIVLATGSEYLASIPGVVIVATLLATFPRRAAVQAALDLSIGGVVPALLIAGYHLACFGSPFRTGYSFVVRPEFARGHASGLMGLHLPTLAGTNGLLFGEARGLFFLGPASAVALGCGILHAIRSRDPASRAGVLALMSMFCANAGYYMWWGGAAAGPRHLVPALGFLSFGLAAAWQSRARVVTTVLLVVSVANFLVLTGVGLEAPDHRNVLVDYAYRRLAAGDLAALSGASNLGIRLGLARGATLGPVLVWLLLGGRFLSRHVEAWTSTEPISGVAIDTAEQRRDAS